VECHSGKHFSLSLLAISHAGAEPQSAYSFHHARDNDKPDDDPVDPICRSFFDILVYDFQLNS
jgi:hypothetical protein